MNSSKHLQEYVVCMSGKLPNNSKAQMRSKLESCGATVATSVTAKVTHLLVDLNGKARGTQKKGVESSKVSKARKMGGITIIDEDTMINLINDQSPASPSSSSSASILSAGTKRSSSSSTSPTSNVAAPPKKKSKKLKGTQKSSAGVSFSADLAGESLVKKMKVIQLRAELEKRNVSLKKQVAKPLLISMLLSAMAEDKEN